MSPRLTIACVLTVGSFSLPVPAVAGPVLFTTEAAFRAAVGDVQEIDFQTLPDGTPSHFGAFITPEFNYTEQGAEFFSYASDLFIAGSPGGFDLFAGSFEMSIGPRTWLIADPVEPALAVGFELPGGSSLRVYGVDGMLMLAAPVGASGSNFVGVHSPEDPIGRIELDRGSDRERIGRFVFAPVPEPATLVFLLLGSAVGVRARRFL